MERASSEVGVERQRISISHSPVRCCRYGVKIRSNALCLHIFSTLFGLVGPGWLCGKMSGGMAPLAMPPMSKVISVR